ncbi:MAG: hypothetical protein RRA35_10350 [Desulfomonilia bacterium]|nr:hypothetical protein [Desulfomonilia bacterium]
MVLRASGNPGLQYIIGITIIALSIYAFYLLIASKNSPQLFLTPIPIDTGLEACEHVTLDGCSLCIPQGVSLETVESGWEFFSPQEKIRGKIEVFTGLPRETSWRQSLRNPFIRAFIGDEASMGSFELMEKILKKKYNPTLMGAKAGLIPPWVKDAPEAAIFIPRDDQVIIFSTEFQSLALVFREPHIAMVTVDGRMERASLAAMVTSITLP